MTLLKSIKLALQLNNEEIFRRVPRNSSSGTTTETLLTEEEKAAIIDYILAPAESEANPI